MINPAFQGQYGGMSVDPSTGQLISNLNISPTISGAIDPRFGMLQNQAFNQALSARNLPGLTGYQQSQMQQLGMMGAGALGQAQAGMPGAFQAPQFDVEGAAQREFGMLSRLMEPGQQQARSAQEQRLFAQGRLGSSGGMMQQRALGEAQEQQRLQAAQQAIASGRAAQQQMFGQAAQGQQLNLGRQQQLFGQGMMATQAAGNLQELQRTLQSPERQQQIQQQAASLGMSIDQYINAVQQQAFGQQFQLAGLEQGMLGRGMAAQQAQANVMAGGAPYAAQAAMSPGMMALASGLGGLGQGFGQVGMLGARYLLGA
jgi:hypothetical protein